MKISINGKIIDTENIFSITEVKHYDYDHGEEISLKTNPKYSDKGGFIGFSIEFFNEKSINFEKLLYDFSLKDRNLPLEPHFSQMKEFRDSIVKIWSANQSTIPQFNL